MLGARILTVEGDKAQKHRIENGKERTWGNRN